MKGYRFAIVLVVAFVLNWSAGVASRCGTLPRGFQSRLQMRGTLKLHYVRREGSGETIILLHGWPQTWASWIKVMELLPEEYDVISVDLRGVGLSEKPIAEYDKKTMAKDIQALMNDLRIDQANIVGHDIGGMTGYALASQFPGRVKTFTIIDVPLPGTDAFDTISRDPRAWHFAFNAAPEVPEALTTGREEYYYGSFIRKLAGSANAVTEDEIGIAVRAYSFPKTATAGFNWYRAFGQDAKDNQQFFKQKLPMPVLALNAGLLSPIPYVLEMMKPLALDVQGQALSSGHWIPEEKPEELTKILTKFFADHRG